MKKPFEIIQAVKFNNGEAWALNRDPQMEYERHGDTIIGMDFPFFNCFYFEKPVGRFRAFAGRKFSIELVGGEVVECDGQWWSGVTGLARSLMGDDVGWVTAKGIGELAKCYVFNGYVGNKIELENFRREYSGSVLPYHDYERILREGMQ